VSIFSRCPGYKVYQIQAFLSSLSSQGEKMNQKHIERWQVEFEKADTKTVQKMLAEAPELVNVKVNKISPLLNASVRIKDLDKVKALVEAGADVNNNMALREGNEEIVNTLLR